MDESENPENRSAKVPRQKLRDYFLTLLIVLIALILTIWLVTHLPSDF